MGADEAERRGLRVRAAQCVALLVGFYALALLVVAFVIGVNVVMAVEGVPAPLLWIPSALIVLAILVAVGTASFMRPATPAGVWLGRSDAPGLFGIVDEIAARAEVPAPSRLLLVDDANAFARQDSWFLGLWTRRRVVGIGWPLLIGLSIAEVTAILAHEIGHFAKSHTRSGPFIYRAHEAMNSTVDLLHGASIFGTTLSMAFAAYRKLFLRTSRAISRDQERHADELAVMLAGTEATVSALRGFPRLGLAHARFRTYIEAPWWQARHTPVDSAPIFERILDAIPRALVLPTPRPSEYDTHPSLPERLTAIGELPTVDAPSVNNQRELVTLLSARIDTTIELTGKAATERDHLEPSPASDVLDAVLIPNALDQASRITRKANAMLQCDRTIESALAIFLEGRASELGRLFRPDLQLRASKKHAYLTELARPILMTALVQNGCADWTLDPATGLTLTSTTSRQLIDVNQMVETILNDPTAARAELERYGFTLAH